MLVTEAPSTSGSSAVIVEAHPARGALRNRSCRRARRRRSLAVRAASETVRSAAAAQPSVSLLALKEWAPTCAALAAGDQTILLRKGGIREPLFAPAAHQFLLFETAFHTEAPLLKPAARDKYASKLAFDPRAETILRFSCLAKVTGAWTTYEPSVLEALDDLHVWTPAFLESRLRWRQSQPITVLELRAFILPAPVELEAREDWWGCFSWVDTGLPVLTVDDARAAGATPALDDDAFAARQVLARRQLAQLQAQELMLP